MFSVNSDHAVTCPVSLCTIVDLLVVPPSFLCQKQCVCGNYVLIHSKEIKDLGFLCSQSLLNSTIIIIIMPAVIALLQSNVLYRFCHFIWCLFLFCFWRHFHVQFLKGLSKTWWYTHDPVLWEHFSLEQSSLKIPLNRRSMTVVLKSH